jgi:hypothetical protein
MCLEYKNKLYASRLLILLDNLSTSGFETNNVIDIYALCTKLISAYEVY